MKQQPNKKTVGAFIVAGIAAFLAILVITFGAGYRSRHKDMYVMYFHESIKGLAIGSPVVLNGVEVGKVAKIEIVPDVATYEFNIPVYVTFNNIQKTISMPSGHHDWSEEKLVNALIAKGLHAKLVNQNLLTGQLMIELDVKPAKTTMTKGEADGIIEIPTTLSSLTELSSNFENIPFREVVENLNATLTEFKEILGPAASVSRDLSNKSAATLNNFNHAVEDVSRAANSLRNLTDYLEQHPDALIRGRK